MKKIKYIIIIMFLILLTGCKGNYNLTINKDLSVDEEINLSIDKEENTYDKTVNLFESNNIDDSLYHVTQNDKYVIVTYKENFKNFKDYMLNSKFYSRIINDEDFYQDKKTIFFKGKSILKLDDNKTDSNLNNSFYITDLKINLKTPLVVKNSNADSVKDNIYTWELKKSDTNKNISFKINFLKENNLYIVIIALCVGVVLVSAIIGIRNYLKEKNI